MNTPNPLLAAWAKTLDRRRNDPAVFDEMGAPIRSFSGVEEHAREFERTLDQFAPGAVLAVQIGNDPDWPSIFLASLRRRLVTLPLDSSISEQDRATALQICRASGLIRTSNGKFAITTSENGPVAWGDNMPCLLKLTSGTTAAPRAIRFRSDQLIADCVQICDTMGISDADVNFGVIPISHSYGFSNLLTPLLIRGVPIALSSDRLPRAILRNLQRSEATVFPGMPVFYQAFAEITDPPPLPKLRLCISAGAPLSAGVAKQFQEKFHLAVHSFYGSSECGGICYDREADLVEEGFVGSTMLGVHLEPIEPNGTATQVRVRSEAVGDGYFPEPDSAKLTNGTFVPDDLLHQCDSGWKIVGRTSDLINVAGKKVNPAEVEAELLTVPGVREAVVFGRKSSRRNQEVAACVVANPAVSENDVLKVCRQRLSGWQVPKRIFLLNELPVNERGKLSRRELGVRFADK